MRRIPFAGPTEKQRTVMREAGRLARRHVVDIDPEDPTQQLDDTAEFDIEPLDLDARSAAEIAEDLDIAAAENVLGDSEPADADDERAGDTGELYGVRTPHAGDTDLAAPEDRDAFEGAELGENWLESLEEHAATLGPKLEEEIVIVDDSDREHPSHRGRHPTERDRPIADKGSGGPGGR